MKKLIALLFLAASLTCFSQHRVTIPVVSTFVTGSAPPPPPPSGGPTAANYTSKNLAAFVESPAGTWSIPDQGITQIPIGITSTQFRTASTVFTYQADYTAATARCGIALSVSATVPSSLDVCDYFIQLTPTGVFEASVPGYGTYGSYTPVNGDKIRFRIDASNLVHAEYYRGTTWTLILDYPTANTSKMYMVGRTYTATGTTPNILLNPVYQ